MENIWCQGEFTSQFSYLIVLYHIGVEDVGFRLYIVFLLITESLLYNLFVGVTTVSSSGKIKFIVIINIWAMRTFNYISISINWRWVNNLTTYDGKLFHKLS